MANTILLDSRTNDDYVILPGSWRNFSGKRTQFNDEGKRNFTLQIKDKEKAEYLKGLGLNVKEYKSSNSDPNEDPIFTLKIKINFNDYGPKVYLYTEGDDEKSTLLTEDTIGILDGSEILGSLIEISLFKWTSKAFGEGATAYLRNMSVQIRPNRFGSGFNDSPERINPEDLPF